MNLIQQRRKKMIELQTYLKMLTWKRPYGSEYEFAQEFLAPLGVEYDSATENWMLCIGDTDTIFTSHLDAVHDKAEAQKIIYVEDMGVVYKDDGQPLGADDASGVFIMMNMIEEKVPGLYLFHVGEECGGIGSDDFVKAYEDVLAPYNKVISFDRKGTGDIITHQAGGRCCSDVFAKSLSSLLSCSEYKFKPDDTGLFTDSANFTHLVSECTNVSVGYEGEHTKGEIQDTIFLMNLVKKCIKADWDSLPVQRDPKEIDYGWGTHGSSRGDLLNYPDLLVLVDRFPEQAANIMYGLQVDTSDLDREFIALDELQ